MIVIVDYGAGNLKSVKNAFDKLNADSVVSDSAKDIAAADAVVIPGVGLFETAMNNLASHGLDAAIKEAATTKPILGICLGMQLFFDGSDESPNCTGLSLLKGRVRNLETDLKMPHIGWTSVKNRRGRLLPDEDFFYFCHSFCLAEDVDGAAAVSDYGMPFTAAVERENIFGVQFHPEKSGKAGLRLLQTFVDTVGGNER